MASLPSAGQNHYTYEVFLSFRGEDTRFGFTDHLFEALCDKGIKTFRDDDELRKGEEISPALLKAIEESRVSIIVFSKNYASSRWCLDELVKILECRKTKGQEVRSVFYKVDPSDVRNQRARVGKAFAKLDQCKYKDSLDRWRAALKEAADLAGWPVKEGESEAKVIKKIVEELSTQVVIPSYELPVADHPVGIESCRREIGSLIDVEEENAVRMVGIWGPGGIGKTTIAKAVFNSIGRKFKGSCFLADVRSTSIPHGGLAKLQETLLSDILPGSNLKVCNDVDRGVSLIKKRMGKMKVLLILDDVSDSNQLAKLAPSPDCFGAGSRIIITTRDKRTLTAHGVDSNSIYEVKVLDKAGALELFSWHAFKCNGPPDDFLEPAQRAVRYAQGLPLALQVLGSLLFNRSSVEWEATLNSCSGDPQEAIQRVLRISYDALNDRAKQLFLDIACFFKGKRVDDVTPILEACDRNPAIDMKLLEEKALIRIDRYGIWMHDLIEEMGKHIVLQEGEPSERSRLWNWDDIHLVLTDNTGTKKIKGIQVQQRGESGDEICLNSTSFSQMKSLIYFSSSKGVHYSGNIDYLSNNLTWLNWFGCPIQSFPSNFHPKKLVALNIPDSRHITRLWEGRKLFRNLTYMNLSGCASLMELPDFTAIPNLKELTLEGCESLVKVHDSVGSLRRLETLNANHCSKLIRLPREISSEYVHTISLSNCKRLEEFPKITVKIDSLSDLDLSFKDIKELDSSIGNLIGLKNLSLCECKNLSTLPCSIYGLQNLEKLNLSECSKLVTFPTNSKSLHDDNGESSLSLPKLKELKMKGCNLSDCDFLITLDCSETLTELDLSLNSFVSLPACISKFVNLEKLVLRHCNRLREIPELPPNLVEVDVSCCGSLEKFLKLSKVLEGKESHGIKWINLWNCYRLCYNLGYNMEKLERILLNNQENSPFRVVFPRGTSEVPKWFDSWNEDIENDHINLCQFSIKFSENLKWEKIGLAICAISKGGMPYYCEYAVSINDVGIRGFHPWTPSVSEIRLKSDHVWLDYIPLPFESKAEVDQKGCSSPGPYYMCRVRFAHPLGPYLASKSCGVHLVCQQSKDDEYSSNKVIVERRPTQHNRHRTSLLESAKLQLSLFLSNKVGGGGVETTEQKRHRVANDTSLLESENPQQKKHRGPNSM